MERASSPNPHRVDSDHGATERSTSGNMAPRATSSEERIMKPNSLVVRMAGVLIIGLMAGCAAPRLVQISEPVGPAPIVLPSRDAGRLVVYTEEDSSTGEENVSCSYK